MITIKSTSAPQGRTANRGVQFLSPTHCLNGPIALKVTKVTQDKPDNNGNPIVIFFVDSSGTRYSKGFKETSTGLALIVELLGADERKWIGKSLSVNAQRDEETGDRLTYALAK